MIRHGRWPASLLLALLCLASSGCTAFLEPVAPFPVNPQEPTVHSHVPREMDMVSLPPYVIEPPDILMINAIKIVPKPPHFIEPFDGLLVRVEDQFLEQPITAAYSVDPEGKIDLGPAYGRVSVVNMTVDEAAAAIRNQLAQTLPPPLPQVTVSLAFSQGAQQIVGEHLVGSDGRVNLGTYGSVYLTGLTIDEAREKIEQHLSHYLEDPKVVVDIFAYNSKKYYIITQGAGFGDNVVTAPITGNDTVLDAIAFIQGIPQVSSTKIWIARPSADGECEQILPVNWQDISSGALTATNYQLFPGDRLFIAEDPMIKFDSVIAKMTRPFERLFGFVSLGTATLQRIRRFGLSQFN